MKKIIIIVLAVVLMASVTYTASAQFSIGANAGIAMTTGSFGQEYNTGFGGYANGTYALNDNMSIGFNAGFYAFKGIEFGEKFNSSARIVPILADFKYFFDTEGFMPYVSTGVGMYLVYSSHTSPAVPELRAGGVVVEEEVPETEHSNSSGKFGVAPTVGFLLGSSDELRYGASVTYNITFSGANHVGINIGVIYPLGQ